MAGDSHSPPSPGVGLGQEMPPGRHRGDRGSGCWGSLSPELWEHIRTPFPCAQDEVPQQPCPNSWGNHPGRSRNSTNSQACTYFPYWGHQEQPWSPPHPLPGSPLLPALVCSRETSMRHNSHHQQPFTSRGLTSLSCFPSPKLGSAGVCSRNLSSYSLSREPEHCHNSQGLPYKLYSQKSLRTTTKKPSLTPQRQVT